MSIAISMPLEIYAEPRPVVRRAKRYLLPALLLSLVLHAGLLVGSFRTPLPGSAAWNSGFESDELELDIQFVERPQGFATDALPLVNKIESIPSLTDDDGDPKKPGLRIAEGDREEGEVTLVNAADRIFTEIRQVLWNYNKVLVVWCFDESPTMRADRYRLAGEIDALYDRFDDQVTEEKSKEQKQAEAEEQRKTVRRYDSQLLPPDAVITSVMSFGDGIQNQTEQPTIDKRKIQKAIRTVPTNESGMRRMCLAVMQGISHNKQYKQFNISKDDAEKQRKGEGGGELTEQELQRRSALIAKLNEIFIGERQMVFILVTDEEGDLRSNHRFLEEALGIANQENCRIYVLGRESVFGWPYAPAVPASPAQVATGLHIGVGTETARPEVLQADGLGRREDFHPSGFGPYEQSRLAYETGGIFFMCPPPAEVFDEGKSFRFDEQKVFERNQRMAASRNYHPDLVSRAEYDEEILESEFRGSIKTIITQLNPRDIQIFDDPSQVEENDPSKVIVRDPLRTDVETQLRFDFPYERHEFMQISAVPYREAERLFIQYRKLLQWLDSLEPLRAEEPEKRWQANYDLLRAEMGVLRARLYEYGVLLKKARKSHPPWKPEATRIKFTAFPEDETWKGAGRRSVHYAQEARKLLEDVVREHPDTVWALRAQSELDRGFGVQLIVY